MYKLRYLKETGLVNLITTWEMPQVDGHDVVEVETLPVYGSSDYLYVRNGGVEVEPAILEE